jgi:predicted AlkP superfamily phosphohydrolase/phosphomutase
MTGAKSKAGRVVLIGLDACDALTVRRMAAAGELPNLARLLAEGSNAVVRNSFGLFAGAVWADFTTGVGPARHRLHCWDHIDE